MLLAEMSMADSRQKRSAEFKRDAVRLTLPRDSMISSLQLAGWGSLETHLELAEDAFELPR